MNKYKKIALRLWAAEESDRNWVLQQLTSKDSEKISNLLSELESKQLVPDKKTSALLFNQYLSYSNQEIELLNNINKSLYNETFSDLAKQTFDVNGNFITSKKYDYKY